jgi:hypothetical protein
MGTWETNIFGDDTACDVRDEYREFIEDGVSDAEATRRTLKKFKGWFKGPEGTSAIVGLAVAQSKIGRLDPKIRDLALAAIDRGGDLAIWNEESPKDAGKRKAALEAARAQITGPQPARKHLKPPRRLLCDLVAGDVLAFDRPVGPALIRVVRVKLGRRFETPLLEELVFRGNKAPPAEVIQELPARELRGAHRDARFEAMILTSKDAGWKEAGFLKVARIPARDDDGEPDWSGSGIFWPYLAKLYRQGENYPG